ncbi:MAG: DUF4870 domain-containing protein [Candidatus Moranbacteria bacterium]|nr:DUF4870 domain-containing protein [Candidatus Moranbacteria bacterium]
MVEKKKKTAPKTGAGNVPSESKDIQENKILAMLSYLGILFLIPLLLKPNSKFVKFHVKQGIILTIGWVIGMVLYPFLGLGFLLHIAIIVFSIMGIINVSEGKTKKLPIISDLAEKLKF